MRNEGMIPGELGEGRQRNVQLWPESVVLNGKEAGIKMSTASVLTLREIPLSQAHCSLLTRHDRAEHMNGMTFLAMIVRGQKRPRHTHFKGSRRVLPGLLSGLDQDYPRLEATYRVIERT
jgi:hypothetical protein